VVMKLKLSNGLSGSLNFGFVFTRYFLRPFIIFLIAAFVMSGLSFSVFADIGDGPAYGKGRLSYNNFMKSMQHLTSNDFSGVEKVSDFISKVGISDGELLQLSDLGKKIYNKYKVEIDDLINNYDRLVDIANPLPGEAQYAAIRSSDPVIDFKYTRALARVLAAVSRWLESEKRYEDALKLTTLTWRFGQIMHNGDSGVSSLITAMIGTSVKNIAARENICRLLIAGDFDAGFYRSYSTRLLKLIDDEMDMSQIMYCERRSFINVVEYEVFVKSGVKTEYSEMVDKLPADRFEEGKKYSTDIFNAYFDSVSVYLTEYKDEPYNLSVHIEAMSKKIAERGQPSLWNLLNPVKSVGDILLAIAVPNFSRAYEQFLCSKYYPYGAAILAKTLAEVKGGAAVPESIEALEKLCGIKLLNDYFNKDKGPLIYKKIGDYYMLYSRGADYNDDNADSDKDVVLFRIPAGRKGE